jgi:hypothetical protein
MNLLSIESDPKTIKGSRYGFLTAVQYFKPNYKTCMFASKGCMSACLNTAGRGNMSPIQKSRKNKRNLFYSNIEDYSFQLTKEIHAFVRKAQRNGKKPCVRLNGTSDITWEIAIPNILKQFQGIVQFYDYTKNLLKALCYNNKPISYTFSRDETTSEETIKQAIKNNINVAVVFRNALPDKWLGIPVINGDNHDLRFLDPKGYIVGLRAKGKARHDSSGFVVDA